MNERTNISTALAITSFEDMDRVANQIAKSQMFGCKTPESAFVLMMLCVAEGLNPIDALRRFHIVDGKPARRADSIASDFEAQGGLIIWHARTDELVGATFFSDKTKVDDEARKRSRERFKAAWELIYEESGEKRAKLMEKIADLSHDGEEVIIRTLQDAQEKGIAMTWKDGKEVMKANWKTSPRQMLTARCVTEGVRLIKPSVIAGMGTEDEVRDTLDMQHQQLLQDAGQQPGQAAPSDIEAMRAVMESHLANAAASNHQPEKQRLLGLASELRCQIAEAEEAMKPKPTLPAPGTTETPKEEPEAKHVETEVLPPEGKDNPPAPEVEPEPEEEDWMRVMCNYGTTETNKFFGKTMKEMFVTSKLESATKIADILVNKSKFMKAVAEKVAAGTDLDPIEEMNYFAILKGKQHVVARTVAAAKKGAAK